MRVAPYAAVAIAVLTTAAARANEGHVSIELVPSVTAVEPGGKLTVATVFRIEKGWHLYWINPGETGTPPEIQWTAPPGVTVGASQFPTPKRINANGLTAYGYEGTLVLLHEVAVPKDAKGDIELKAAGNWVVCADACVAESQTATVKVSTADKRGPDNRPDEFSKWRAKQPKRLEQPLVATIDADGKHGMIEIKQNGLTPVEFFPPKADFAEWEAPVKDGDTLRVRFRVLPGAPVSYTADAITVAVESDVRVALIQPIQFKFQGSHKE